MTLHGAKGLEFDHVYIAGMEDGLFPGEGNIFAGEEELEEERRLAYVGMTRAKEELTLTAAGYRFMRGQPSNNPVSMFVREIPEEYIEGNLPRVRSRESIDLSYTGSWNSTPRQSTSVGGTGYRKPYAPTPNKDIAPSKKPFAAVKGLGSLSKGSSMANTAVDYTIGDRVRHVKFGEGVVKEMENRDGSTYVTVEFDTAGVRVLAAAFARLVKL